MPIWDEELFCSGSDGLRPGQQPARKEQGDKSAEDLGKNEAWEVDHFTPKAEIYATTLYSRSKN